LVPGLPLIRSVIAFGGRQRASRQVKPSAAMWRWTGDRWESVSAEAAPPARSGTLMASDMRSHRLLLFGGRVETTSLPSCPSPSEPGQACIVTVSPDRILSDTWAFTGGL
jgi:hypothetical protein